MTKSPCADIDQLRRHIDRLEGARRAVGVLPFGVAAIDEHLPGGGLALGALHEMTGAAKDAVDGAVAGLFAAGIAARAGGAVLWCAARPDFFAAGMAQAGLPAGRVIHVEANDDTAALAACEEGLRYGGLGAVVAEVSRLPMIASRRLQLAAEEGRTMALVVRRWRREKDAAAFDLPTTAVTRWRVAALPSAPLPVPGIGRARWRLELLRCKGGRPAEFDVEACDDQGCLALSAPLVHRPAAAADRQRYTAS
ncbi:MAG: ImuA family protein [Asticcacaulis sp.]